MSEEFTEQVTVLDVDSNVTITLNGNRATVYAGGNSKAGGLRLKDGSGAERVTVDAGDGLLLRDDAAVETVKIGSNGTLLFRDADGRVVLRFVSGRGNLDIGAEEKPGQLSIHDERGEAVIRQDGATATVTLGGEGNGGDLKVLNEEGGVLFQVSASLARLRGALIVGARNAKGEIGIMGPMGRPAIHADGGTAKLQLGNLGNAGDFVILDNVPNPVLDFSGLTATLTVGGERKPGYLVLRDENGSEVGRISGKEAGLFLGREGKAGEMMVLNGDGQASFSVDGANGIVSVGIGENRVILDGNDGDIKLSGADCAEEFALVDATDADPGTVMVIKSDNALSICSKPYDSRVAGVISGAGGVRSAILLNQGEDGSTGRPVALNGRVFCKVDAGYAPIELGDLLTTCATHGHAMKASNPKKAHGAVLGKALGSLDTGTGLIPILVSLL